MNGPNFSQSVDMLRNAKSLYVINYMIFQLPDDRLTA